MARNQVATQQVPRRFTDWLSATFEVGCRKAACRQPYAAMQSDAGVCVVNLLPGMYAHGRAPSFTN
jgi:hypothetical protein